MPVSHVLLCRFKDGTSNDKIEEPKLLSTDAVKACCQIIGLKDNYIMPQTGKTYIKSFVGGKDDSPENAQNGMTHCFLSEFEAREHRDFFIFQDPVHVALDVKISPVIDKFIALDFTHNELS
ncbi:hypothetical protein N7540_002300 [Penicillium herquei]|nr:hypothetical protein N7540_002300 [Penicillium herquei]